MTYPPQSVPPQYDPRFLSALMSATTMMGIENQIIAPNANPFALGWVPAGSNVNGVKIGETRQVNGRNITSIGSGSLHVGDSDGADLRPSWHHVMMEPRGEVFFDPDAEIPTSDESVSLGNTATLLKARIEIAIGNGRRQSVDFDILAGVDFSLAALHVLKIEALVPDPSSIPEVPPDVPTRSIATVVSTGVYRGLPPRGSRQTLTYSQVFFLVGELQAFMPVVPAAREVEIFCDQPAVANNSLVVDFLYMLGNPIATTVSATPPFTDFYMVGSVNVPINARNTARVTIPGQANVIHVTASGLTSPIVNIVQSLKF